MAGGCDYRCVVAVLGWLAVVFGRSLLLFGGGCSGC